MMNLQIRDVRVPLAGSLPFAFSLIHCPGGPKFSLSVKDNKQKTHLFIMKKKAYYAPGKLADWEIVDAPKVEDWLKAMETRLSENIEDIMRQRKRND